MRFVVLLVLLFWVKKKSTYSLSQKAVFRRLRKTSVDPLIIRFPRKAKKSRLEITLFDFLWITNLLENTKLLASTVFIRPQSKYHMQKCIEQMTKLFDYANENELEGIIFLGDYNARHWS